MYQISAYTDNFDFLYQIFPKMVFAVEKRESEFAIEFCRFEVV